MTGQQLVSLSPIRPFTHALPSLQRQGVYTPRSPYRAPARTRSGVKCGGSGPRQRYACGSLSVPHIRPSVHSCRVVVQGPCDRVWRDGGGWVGRGLQAARLDATCCRRGSHLALSLSYVVPGIPPGAGVGRRHRQVRLVVAARSPVDPTTTTTFPSLNPTCPR